mmetsp:Transcript_1201/g.1509  ORF Transcript_1201/g.1509 Transcript_1201/m.1509 type:complete len:108 (+) Transcript_1201:40-363(+)
MAVELSGVDLEVGYLQLELMRLGADRSSEGVLACATFAELMDCPRCEQIFEALVGTLRAAKKRKVITYEGQMLLKGVSDNVQVKLLQPPPAGLAPAEAVIHCSHPSS